MSEAPAPIDRQTNLETNVGAVAPTRSAMATKPSAITESRDASAKFLRSPVAIKKAVSKRRVAGVKKAAKPSVKAVRKAKGRAPAVVNKRQGIRKSSISAINLVAAPGSTLISKGKQIMDSTNWFADLAQLPGADKLQALFADVGIKGQDVVRKTQEFGEQLTNVAKTNIEAVVESGRIATSGVRDLGSEIVASTKSSVALTSVAVKSLTEAKSPTEFFQLQSNIVRASLDGAIAGGAKLTERLVKLAGDASRPLSGRVTATAKKFSELTN